MAVQRISQALGEVLGAVKYRQVGDCWGAQVTTDPGNAYRDLQKVWGLLGGRWDFSEKATMFPPGVIPQQQIDLTSRRLYIPTPGLHSVPLELVAAMMTEIPDPPHMGNRAALEPVTVNAAIARALQAKGYQASVCESDPTLGEDFRSDGLAVIPQRVFDVELPGEDDQFRVIAMAPPLAEKMDTLMTLYAFEYFLEPGGTLVSIVSAGGKFESPGELWENFRGVFKKWGVGMKVLPKNVHPGAEWCVMLVFRKPTLYAPESSAKLRCKDAIEIQDFSKAKARRTVPDIPPARPVQVPIFPDTPRRPRVDNTKRTQASHLSDLLDRGKEAKGPHQMDFGF